MKKNIALLLGLVLGLGFVSCSSDDDDDESVNGEGKYLAEELTTRYDWKDGKRSDKGEIYRIIKYNEKGQSVSAEYPSDSYKSEYVYDDEGRRIEWNVTRNNISEKYEFEYNGNVSVRYHYSSKGKLWETIKSEYDDEGRLVKETTIYTNSGYVFTFSYGENTETRTYTNLKDGSLIWQDVVENDSHNNISKSIRTLANGDKILFEYTQEYDSKGRICKIVGPIVTAEEGVDTAGLAHTKYWERSFNDDGLVEKEHIAVPADNEEYDLEYTYKYKKK